MYDPVVVAKYKDGRRAYQFERPKNLAEVPVEVYHFVDVTPADGRSRRGCIIYIANDASDILGNKKENSAFFITDRSGVLPNCVYRDGACVSVVGQLSSAEIETESASFGEALGIRGEWGCPESRLFQI